MEKVDRILDSIIRSLGLSKKFREGKAMAHWEEAVGPEISRHTAPIKVRDSKLFVEVDGASWRTELMFLKKKILIRLNSLSDETVITDIIFVAGSGRSYSE
jgi:predicted nucleic acid-binding Zn ribbon protein